MEGPPWMWVALFHRRPLAYGKGCVSSELARSHLQCALDCGCGVTLLQAPAVFPLQRRTAAWNFELSRHFLLQVAFVGLFIPDQTGNWCRWSCSLNLKLFWFIRLLDGDCKDGQLIPQHSLYSCRGSASQHVPFPSLALPGTQSPKSLACVNVQLSVIADFLLSVFFVLFLWIKVQNLAPVTRGWLAAFVGCIWPFS